MMVLIRDKREEREEKSVQQVDVVVDEILT